MRVRNAQARRNRTNAEHYDRYRLMLDQSRIEAMARAFAPWRPCRPGGHHHGWLARAERVDRGDPGAAGRDRRHLRGPPNVTTDAAALALKSGIVLRGSRIAARSNEVLGDVVAGAVAGAGVPPRP
jgi:hypothetical protein